jgi:hypothetical protein
VRVINVLMTALAAAAMVAGCGGSDAEDEAPVVSSDQRQILSTVDALQTASREGDAARICKEIFTESLARSIREGSSRSCEQQVRATLASPDAQIAVGRQIEVNGSRATATVREQNGNTSSLLLVKDEGRWRIERITAAGS